MTFAVQNEALPVVRETLPVAAQWGILGVLVLAFGAAVVYLVAKLDRVRKEHATELLRMNKEHTDEITALHAERVRETRAFAETLAELLQPVQDVVGQVEEITKALASRAARRRPEDSQR